MVTRKSSTGASKKLKIKKETLKDLDARRKVKGGGVTPGTLVARVSLGGACCPTTNRH